MIGVFYVKINIIIISNCALMDVMSWLVHSFTISLTPFIAHLAIDPYPMLRYMVLSEAIIG